MAGVDGGSDLSANSVPRERLLQVAVVGAALVLLTQVLAPPASEPRAVDLPPAVAEAPSVAAAPEETEAAPVEAPTPAAPQWGTDVPSAGLQGARPGERFVSAMGMTLVWIPAGTFEMGSPSGEAGRSSDDMPRHEVTISKGFWMGQYEVTQAEWQKVKGANPSTFKGADRPVETVSVFDCRQFGKDLTEQERRAGKLPEGLVYRLPTEAEWEYACRAGSPASRYGSLDDIAWHAQNAGGQTHEVGRKQANAWGLYDVVGNVWEWCHDFLGSNDNWGVGRGGGFSSEEPHCRAASRFELGGYDCSEVRGCRMVLAAPALIGQAYVGRASRAVSAGQGGGQPTVYPYAPQLVALCEKVRGTFAGAAREFLARHHRSPTSFAELLAERSSSVMPVCPARGVLSIDGSGYVCCSLHDPPRRK